MSSSQIYERPAPRSHISQKMISPVNRRMLLWRSHKLSCCCCCCCCCFPFAHSAMRGCLRYTHHNVPKARGRFSNTELKPHSCCFRFSPSCFPSLVFCDALPSRDWKCFASRADDIINDKSGVFSTSSVLNASLPNVYYQRFGPGPWLRLGMVRNHFLEVSIKDLHVKDQPKVDRYKFSHLRLSKLRA